MLGLEGKRVLVTGAGKGIGRETVTRLVEHGAAVHALSRSAADLASLARETGAATVAVDLQDLAAVERAVAPLLPLDGLVNCAGVVEVQPFLEMDPESFRRTIAVNTLAPIHLAQLVARDCLRRGRGGAVVNVSSIAAWVGTPGHTAYCASKAALDAVTRVMAVELGGQGIRVNSVNPVVTWTPMAEKAWSDPVKAERMKARIPFGRFAATRDVADAICYLLSDAAAMVHGVCLPVDGGFSAG